MRKRPNLLSLSSFPLSFSFALDQPKARSPSNGILHQGPEMDHQPGHGERARERKKKHRSMEGGCFRPAASLSRPRLPLISVPLPSKKKVAGAGAVAGITALKLQKVNVDSSGVSLGAECFLWDQSGQSNPNQACIYAYTVAGVSVAAALALSILQCFTCNLCGLGDWADALFEGVAAAWWGKRRRRERTFLRLDFSFIFLLRVFSFLLLPPPKGSLLFSLFLPLDNVSRKPLQNDKLFRRRCR